MFSQLQFERKNQPSQSWYDYNTNDNAGPLIKHTVIKAETIRPPCKLSQSVPISLFPSWSLSEGLAEQLVAVKHSLALLLDLFLPALLSSLYLFQHSVPTTL